MTIAVYIVMAVCALPAYQLTLQLSDRLRMRFSWRAFGFAWLMIDAALALPVVWVVGLFSR